MFSKTGGLAAKLYSELLELRGSLLTLQVSVSSLVSWTVESGRQSPSRLSEPDSTPELDWVHWLLSGDIWGWAG